MDRRHFISLVGAGSAALSLPRLRARAQPGPGGYNVLMIIIEDLNDWIGCLGGHPDTITPNMDAFAASGVLFTNAHCSSPACNPSRASFLSGLSPHRTGIVNNDEDWRPLMPDGHPMLPDRFRRAGYHSVGLGKVYHGGDVDSHWDRRWRGPDLQDDLNGKDPYLPYHPNTGLETPINQISDWTWGRNDIPVDQMHDRRLLSAATTLMDNGLPQPFFMAFGTHKTHYPWTVPRRYFERFNPDSIHLPDIREDDLADIPPAGRVFAQTYRYSQIQGHKSWRDIVHAYLATINYMDETIGQLLNAFDQRPEASNTIVVMMADHGHHVGEKLHFRKMTLWREASHSFLAVRVPGLTQPGSVCSEAVSLMDIYPTLAELCQLPPLPYEVDGVSLLPQLLDPSTPREQPALISYEDGNHAVEDERWRYIRYATGAEELYDHQNDPEEWTNLATFPAYEPIKQQLAQWMPPLGG